RLPLLAPPDATNSDLHPSSELDTSCTFPGSGFPTGSRSSSLTRHPVRSFSEVGRRVFGGKQSRRCRPRVSHPLAHPRSLPDSDRARSRSACPIILCTHFPERHFSAGVLPDGYSDCQVWSHLQLWCSFLQSRWAVPTPPHALLWYPTNLPNRYKLRRTVRGTGATSRFAPGTV